MNDSPISLHDINVWEAQLRTLPYPFSQQAQGLMQGIDYGREALGLPPQDWTAFWGYDPFVAVPRPRRADPTARPHWKQDHRATVWDKTGGRCWYCGVQTNPWRDFTIDHFLARSAGGGDTLPNLVPACRACNNRKGDRTLAHFRRLMTALLAPAAPAPYHFYFEQLLGEEASER